MTPELAIQQNPWMVAATTAGLGMLGYLFDKGEIERDAWPKENPAFETELIRYRFRAPRQRMRRPGREWIGWDDTAPAALTVVIDAEGARAFGVRCTLWASKEGGA